MKHLLKILNQGESGKTLICMLTTGYRKKEKEGVHSLHLAVWRGEKRDKHLHVVNIRK